VKMFEEQVYGRAPGRPRDMHFAQSSLATNALQGLATRKEITIWYQRGTNGPAFHVLLYIPNQAAEPVPAFLGINFNGNYTVNPDPGITLWPAGSSTNFVRGRDTASWPVETILQRGYAFATVGYTEIEPDSPTGWQRGIRGALSPAGTNTVFKPDEWGAISAWAWGLSRVLDYLETDAAIDARRVAVIGHSRLGKTALWAGAHDQRFALVIANDSGEGGAALARRWFGETTALINAHFPHWFCGNFKQYSNHEDRMPGDQHEVIALVAPRPVYVASASRDLWSDPLGEFLSAKAAEPVYRLYGEAGLGVNRQPPVNHPVGDFIGYHLREGRHDLTVFDWEQYLNFADRHLRHLPVENSH
jgi:hypothetical protein